MDELTWREPTVRAVDDPTPLSGATPGPRERLRDEGAHALRDADLLAEIGRASCRERV